VRKVRALGQRLPLSIWFNAASDTLKGERSAKARSRLSEAIRAERKISENQDPLEGKRTRATKILKFLRKAPKKKAKAKMTDSGVKDSMNSTESRFCSAQQPDHCRKGETSKSFASRISDGRGYSLQIIA
jgi:hypothetical protein